MRLNHFIGGYSFKEYEMEKECDKYLKVNPKTHKNPTKTNYFHQHTLEHYDIGEAPKNCYVIIAEDVEGDEKAFCELIISMISSVPQESPLGKTTFFPLYPFIKKYLSEEHQAEKDRDEYLKFRDFNRYVEIYYGYVEKFYGMVTSKDCFTLIQENSSTDKEAFYKFFELLDGFLEQRGDKA